MWKINAKDTITEKPEEEDTESNDKGENCHLESKKSKSKIETILDIHNSERHKDDLIKDFIFNKKGKKKFNNDKPSYLVGCNSSFPNGVNPNNEDIVMVGHSLSSLNLKNDTGNSYYSSPKRILEPIEVNQETEESKAVENKSQEDSSEKDQLHPVLHEEEKKVEVNIFASTNTEKMRFKEALNFFMSVDLSKAKMEIVVENFSQYNCCQKLYLNCSKKLTINPDLLSEREIFFAIAKVIYNENEEIHNRMITTVYKAFTLESECALVGTHWSKIGFQGSSPMTDLRGVGMLGILQMLAFIDRYPLYAKESYACLSSTNNSFILACFLLNLTKLCLELLRCGNLISYCNSRSSIIDAMNEFYFGLISHLLSDLSLSNRTLTIEYASFLLTSLQEQARSNPESIIIQSNELNAKYPALRDSMALSMDNGY